MVDYAKYWMFSLVTVFCFCAHNSSSQIECKEEMSAFEQTAIANGAFKYVDYQQEHKHTVHQIKQVIIENIDSFEFGDDFPLNIWLMFVLEPNDTISEVFICSDLVFSKHNENTIMLEESINNLLKYTPLKAGMLDNEKVKTLFPLKIHFFPN
ncbi:MAG: hypothetical protein JJT77_07120 [Crocinitomicaceae bacterium]|nr:hypothetical protein [Crocinitomicaceae bacterium]